MKKKSFSIPLYRIDVTLIQLTKEDSYDSVSAVLKREGIDAEYISEAADNQKNGYVDGGYTYYNFRVGKVVILFYPTTAKKQQINIYSHEKRHLEDRVLENASVDDKEASAYLSGYLGEVFYDFYEMRQK